MKIKVTDQDDFVYDYLIELLERVKLVQGGTALSATLRRHSKLKNYLIEKQKEQISYIEDRYFNKDGSLVDLAIKSDNFKSCR